MVLIVILKFPAGRPIPASWHKKTRRNGRAGEVWDGRSTGFDQPVSFVDHAMAAATGDGAPCDVEDPGIRCTVWASNDAASTWRTGEAVNVAGSHETAPIIA